MNCVDYELEVFAIEGLKARMAEGFVILEEPNNVNTAAYYKSNRGWRRLWEDWSIITWSPSPDGGFFSRLEIAYEAHMNKTLANLIMEP